MDFTISLEGILIILTIIATGGAITAGVNRWVIKRVKDICKEEIDQSQSLCIASRARLSDKYEDRMKALEDSDNKTDLTIVELKKDIENLSTQHDTTQMMISKLQEHQQETFMKIIEKLK